MKKVLLSVTLAVSILSASNITFQSALSDFENKNYSKSFDSFKELFKSDMINPKVNYYLGRSAFELGLYDIALSSFERILILNENHQRSRLELARVYLALGLKNDAKKEFQTVLNSNPPESVKKNINRFLSKIENSEKRNFLKTYISLGVGQDTNINSSPIEDELLNYMSNEYNLDADLITQDGEISDRFHKEMLNINQIYDFGEKNGLFLDNSIMFYNQNFFSEKNYNILYSSAKLGLGYLIGNYKITLPLVYDKLIYGNNSLLSSFSIIPKVSKNLTPTLSISSYFKYQKKSYDKSKDRGKDSDILEFGLGANKQINSNLLSATLYILNEEKKRNSIDNFIDRDSYNFKLSYFTKIKNTDFILNYIYRKYLYKDSAVKDGVDREDNQQNFYITLSRSISDISSVSLAYGYTNSNSNYTPSDYEKSVYTINYNINF